MLHSQYTEYPQERIREVDIIRGVDLSKKISSMDKIGETDKNV